MTGESHHDDFRQVYYSREKSNDESSTGISKYKSLTCNYCHKKGPIRVDYWFRKKKQSDANVTELIGEDEEQCDILSVTNRSVGTNIDGLLTLNVHSTSVLIEWCSLHTLRFKEEKSAWGILLQVR